MTYGNAMRLGVTGLGVLVLCVQGRADFNYPAPPAVGPGDYFTVAEDGRARCCLVLPERPLVGELHAAANLEVYLKLITGATFVRCRESAVPSGISAIHVGDTHLGLQTPLDLPPVRYSQTELPNVNGCLVQTLGPKTLLIRGATHQATLLGSVGLLRQFLGVRRYWPGEPGGLGDVVPRAATLRLPKIQWRDWPYFISRTMSGCDERGPQSELGRRARLYDFWRMNYTIPSNESYYRLMKSHDHAQEPELFPLINGRRFVPRLEPGQRDPNGWQPCVSNPRVAEIMIDSLRQEFRRTPGQFAQSLSVNDGYGDCTCPACQALDAAGADRVNRVGLCDRYVRFDNRVAEAIAGEFPGKILAFIAYGSMAQPPAEVRLHPMLMPVLCVGGNAFGMWDDWVRTGARHMGLYLYHDDAWFVMPKVDIHQSARRIRYVVQSGLARHFYQEFYGIYPLDGLVGYVEQELLWDPRVSEETILAEHYSKFFGPAATAMRSFYAALEDGYGQWLAAAGVPHSQGPDAGSITDSKSIRQFAVLPLPIVQRAQAALATAVAATQAEGLEGRRVRLVERLFAFAALGAKTYWAGQRLKAADVDGEKDAARVVADAQEAIDAGLALADYKFDVIEKPEIKAYENHPDPDLFYHDLTRGCVHAETVQAIDDGFGRVSRWLVKSPGPSGAAAWWHARRSSEARPILQRLMDIAEVEAAGHSPANVVNDPSFEQRGAAAAAVGGDETDLAAWQRRRVGLWASGGTPFQCRFSRDEAHSGTYAIELSGTQRAGIAESLALSDDSCLRMSVWVKHNDQKGYYSVHTDPRAGAVHMPRINVDIPWKPGQWQKIELLFMPQPGTKSVSLRVFVERQSPGAKIWIDDFSIGRYPSSPSSPQRNK